MIYDFSGSSFHYNADSGVSARFAAIFAPSTLKIDKDFSPDSTNLDGVSALTFTITNPNPAPISGIAFSDSYPANMLNTNPLTTADNCGGTVTLSLGGAFQISDFTGSRHRLVSASER